MVVDQTSKHVSLDGGFGAGRREEVFVKSKGEFTHGIKSFVCVILKEAAGLLCSRGLDFPMLSCDLHQTLRMFIEAGNIVAGFFADAAAGINRSLDRENR